jgi:signal transduction histidine kinase
VNALPTQVILEDRKITYCITDRDLRVIQASDAAGLLASPDDVLGRSLLELTPELIGSEMVLADILAGKLPRFELAGVNRIADDQRTIYLTLISLPYNNSGGQVSGLIHLMQDMTDLVAIEQRVTQQRNELRLLRDELCRCNQQLAAAHAELQSLDEMKSRFVSIAAHELRSPLTAINGYLELLMDNGAGCFTDLQRDYLDIIQSSTHRLLSITSDLLDLTRIETGRLELVLQPIDLAALLRAVTNEYAAQIEAKGQQCTLLIPDGLPAALCDSLRASQILGNLISNATKYTPAGGAISIQLERAADEGFLQVAVRDTGVGIPVAEQKRVFERFFRASNALAAGALGAGLGLHITRALVELHGGEIWLESEVGQGATFFVTFPITDMPANTDRPEQLSRFARGR